MEPTENRPEPVEHDHADACTQRDWWVGAGRRRRDCPDVGVDAGWADRAGRLWTAQCKARVDSNVARNLTQAASGEWLFVLVDPTPVQPENTCRAWRATSRADDDLRAKLWTEHDLAWYLTGTRSSRCPDRADAERSSECNGDAWRLLVPERSNLDRLLASDSLLGRSKNQFMAEALAQLVSHWANIANEPTLLHLDVERPQESALAAAAAAQHVSRAAHETRDSIVHDDPTISRPKVAEFTNRWLGFRATPQMIDAAGDALLHADLDGFDPDDDDRTRQQLRTATKKQHNLLRPIGETQLAGRRLDYLQRELSVPGCGAICVQDTVSGAPSAEAVVLAESNEWDDPRTARILDQLEPDEHAVAVAYAHDPAGSWLQAALSCGLPAPYGEKVRTKLKRLGKQFLERMSLASRPAA